MAPLPQVCLCDEWLNTTNKTTGYMYVWDTFVWWPTSICIHAVGTSTFYKKQRWRISWRASVPMRLGEWTQQTKLLDMCMWHVCLMSYFQRYTCSWHLYPLEKNNYSVGDISDDKCRCAYAIGWQNPALNSSTSMWPVIDKLLHRTLQLARDFCTGTSKPMNPVTHIDTHRC